ncbi:MAG: hypothetical protein HYU51_15670 [Candidatus Rokubacteria bacterium]|nr:hypothetical protein [Candidatus Rokubacteria bacterium]
MPEIAERTDRRNRLPHEVSLGVVDGRQPDEKLEVVWRVDDAGNGIAELRLLAWGEGIGWYAQRTLTLPARLAGLRILLERAERLARGQHAPGEGGADVLPFPGRAAADRTTRASA